MDDFFLSQFCVIEIKLLLTIIFQVYLDVVYDGVNLNTNLLKFKKIVILDKRFHKCLSKYFIGIPVFSINFANSKRVTGASSEALITTVLPIARAGASFTAVKSI